MRNEYQLPITTALVQNFPNQKSPNFRSKRPQFSVKTGQNVPIGKHRWSKFPQTENVISYQLLIIPNDITAPQCT